MGLGRLGRCTRREWSAGRLVWCTRRKWSSREGRLGLGRHLKEMRSVESHQCTCTCIMLYRSLTHIHTFTHPSTCSYKPAHTPHTLTDRSCDVVGWIGAHNGSGVHEREGLAWVGWIGARDESGVHEREGWAWVGWIGARDESGVHEREGWAWVGWIGAYVCIYMVKASLL